MSLEPSSTQVGACQASGHDPAFSPCQKTTARPSLGRINSPGTPLPSRIVPRMDSGHSPLSGCRPDAQTAAYLASHSAMVTAIPTSSWLAPAPALPETPTPPTPPRESVPNSAASASPSSPSSGSAPPSPESWNITRVPRLPCRASLARISSPSRGSESPMTQGKNVSPPGVFRRSVPSASSAIPLSSPAIGSTSLRYTNTVHARSSSLLWSWWTFTSLAHRETPPPFA